MHRVRFAPVTGVRGEADVRGSICGGCGRSCVLLLGFDRCAIGAHNADSPVHEAARRWWDSCLAGSEGVGLAWATLLGFIRITTNRKIVARPLAVREVLDRIQAWLDLPQVHFAQPADGHFAILRQALERLGVGGNRTTDAHLAALAMERGYVLYSTDADFARFPGLRWINPCEQ